MPGNLGREVQPTIRDHLGYLHFGQPSSREQSTEQPPRWLVKVEAHTSLQVNGTLLKPTLYAQHQQDKAVWQVLIQEKARKATERMATTNLSTSLQPTLPSDPAVISCSGTLTCDTSGDLQMDIDQEPSLPPAPAITQSLSQLSQHRQYFYAQKAQASSMISQQLVFTTNPTSFEEPPAPLDWKKCSAFITHQDWVEKLIELIDSVWSHDDTTARDSRKLLIQEIQAYQEHLDYLIESEWEALKLECGLFLGSTGL
ncbi:hypothetical protein BDN67DRAFT_980457 [Paxillus ammoniavirescens]|nr:hypothetical protein BDN67DRAFT_980457 [Paxillus ammoniavirescens]